MFSSDVFTIAIIGGTGRMGKGLAVLFVRAGHQVLIGSRDPKKAALAVDVIKKKYVQLDITPFNDEDSSSLANVVVISVGCSGVPTLSDQRGWKDLFGNKLNITQVAIADELAAAASLMMGQSAEGIPVIHVSGFPYPLIDMPFKDLLRPKERDLFR